jgi:tetratricopeptide (TPR) repeat protein
MTFLAAFVSLAVFAAHPSPAPAIDATVAASRAHTLAGRWEEAERLLSRELEKSGPEDPAHRARLLAERGRVLADRNAYGRRDPEAARRALREALAAARDAGERRSEADALQALAQMRYGETFDTGDWAGVRSEFEGVAAMRERAGDRRGLSETLFYLGLTYEQDGRPAEALPVYRRSLEISEDLGDEAMQSYPRRHIGGIEEERGELDAAERDISLSLELRRRSGALVVVPFAMLQKADFLERRRGRRHEARRLVEQAIDAAEAGQSPRALSAARLELSRMLEESGSLKRSLRYAECARDAAAAFGDAGEIRGAEERIAKLKGRIGGRS